MPVSCVSCVGVLGVFRIGVGFPHQAVAVVFVFADGAGSGRNPDQTVLAVVCIIQRLIVGIGLGGFQTPAAKICIGFQDTWRRLAGGRMADRSHVPGVVISVVIFLIRRSAADLNP